MGDSDDFLDPLRIQYIDNVFCHSRLAIFLVVEWSGSPARSKTVWGENAVSQRLEVLDLSVPIVRCRRIAMEEEEGRLSRRRRRCVVPVDVSATHSRLLVQCVVHGEDPKLLQGKLDRICPTK